MSPAVAVGYPKPPAITNVMTADFFEVLYLFMKKFLSFVLINFCMLCCFAIPGTESFIPDVSGEYVYYKDNSFNRETYIGILFYSESEYQIRYFAPEDNTQFLPEKEIAILVSVDPTANYWSMTGENIISTILPNDEDTILVNYLHDILYDFSSRRIKAGKITNHNVEIYQDYAQFGGNVKIVYDAKIPLFNIKSIIDSKGLKSLECITFGRLKSSDDKSFDNFKGINKKKNKAVSTIYKTGKSKKAEYKGQSLILDENWEQSIENVWTLGNDALISFIDLPKFSDNNNFNEIFLLRNLLENSEESYIDFSDTEITFDNKKNQIKVFSYIYENSGKIIKNAKIFTKKQIEKGFISDKPSDYYYFSISIYSEAYKSNQSYFDVLIKSYSAN